MLCLVRKFTPDIVGVGQESEILSLYPSDIHIQGTVCARLTKHKKTDSNFNRDERQQTETTDKNGQGETQALLKFVSRNCPYYLAGTLIVGTWFRRLEILLDKCDEIRIYLSLSNVWFIKTSL